MKYIALFTFCLLLTLPAFAEDDSWDYPQDGEMLKASEGIMKWCEINGKRVRYSTEVVPGYKLCGEIRTQVTCDPSGRRFFGPSTEKSPPYAFKDCSLGKRLMVERIGDPIEQLPPDGQAAEPNLADQFASKMDYRTDSKNGIERMSTQEVLEARKNFDKLSNQQEFNMAIDMNAIFQQLSDALQEPNKRR